jgi:Acetokinase family
VVHGRDIPAARLVDDGVLDAIRDAAPLAPLHNPANLEGILAASAVFSCPQVSACRISADHVLCASSTGNQLTVYGRNRLPSASACARVNEAFS